MIRKPNQCNKFNKGDEIKSSNMVVVAGSKILTIVKCHDSGLKEAIGDKPILYHYKTEDKAELARAFAAQVKKYFGLVIDKTTPTGRTNAVKLFLKDIKKVTNIEAVEVWGSMKTGNTHKYSDVDIKLTRKKCPGLKKCAVNKLLKSAAYVTVDVCCFPK